MSALSHPMRSLRRAPGLSAAVALTLALGIGLSTALFGYLDSYLHPKVAAPRADRLASVRYLEKEGVRWSSSRVEVDAIHDAGVFEKLAASEPVNATVEAPAGHVFAWGRIVEGDYFELLGGRAVLGRVLSPADDRTGAAPVVVLGNRLWRTAFGSEPAIVGRSIEINGSPCEVVGILSRDFAGVDYAADFFAPTRQVRAIQGVEHSADPDDYWLYVSGRVPAGGGAWPRAAARLASVLANLDAVAPFSDHRIRRLELAAASRLDPDSANDPFFLAARALAGAGVLFLLLAAANVAGLLLARATAREREWAVRKALGASRLELAGAIVGELLPPLLVGLAIGAVLARLATGWMNQLLATPLSGVGPGWASENATVFELGWRTALFATAASFGVLVLASVPPFLRISRGDANRILRSEGSRGGSDRSRLAPRRALVIAQIVMAVTLLAGAGVLLRSFYRLESPRLGFAPRDLSFAAIHLALGLESPDDDRLAFARLLERLRSRPEIAGATASLQTPFASWDRKTDVRRSDQPDAPARSVSFNIVATHYFSTLGVPILSGRAIEARDTLASPPVVVVSEALANDLWPGEDAVGKRLHVEVARRPSELGPDFEVVGVSRNATLSAPDRPLAPMVFCAYGQRLHSRMSLVVRSSAPAPRLEALLRDAVEATRADASLVELVPAQEQLHRSLYSIRLDSTLAATLALSALATALLGLVALQLFHVQLRRRELAIRQALGASPAALGGLVLREGLSLAAWGTAFGLVAAGAAVRLLRSQLFGVDPLDPVTFAAIPLVLVAAVLAASWIPARRAASTDPAESLRSL